MSPADREWVARFDALTLSAYRLLVHPPGGRRRVALFLVYAWLMHWHRWLWVRGLHL